MGNYTPVQFAGAENIHDVVFWLTRELLKIQQTFADRVLQIGGKSNVLPAKPRDGALALADGTNWNPGNGQGVYVNFNAAWHALFQTLPDPVTIAHGGTSQITAAAARAVNGLNVESGTARGDANYTVLNTDRFIFTNAAFTAARTFTLPAANTVNPGANLVIADVAGGVTATNTLSIAPNGTDKIDGSNTTQVALNAAFQVIVLWTDGVSNWKTSGKLPATITQPTRSYLTSGSGATYNTPANCKKLIIRMIGGGGGGGGSGGGAAGGNGGTTTFNSINAAGGIGGGVAAGQGGAGGTGGTGSASLRLPGSGGWAAASASLPAQGAPGLFGMGAGRASTVTNTAGGAGGTNTGAGGAGGCLTSLGNIAHGGGSGEYVELIISSPAASYTYTVGAAGTAGTGTAAGGAGGSGLIIVEEYY